LIPARFRWIKSTAVSHVFIRDVPPFDPFPRPGRFSEKREAGFHAGVMEETADRDAAPHLGPTIPLDQFFDDGLQRNPMQRIAGMSGTHERMANGIWAMAADQDYDVCLGILHEREDTGLLLMARARIARRAGRARKARCDERGLSPCRARLARPAKIAGEKPEDGYVLRLNKSARWAKGVKVEGRSCSRPDGASPDASAT